MTTSLTITKMIAAADALGAPRFGLDLFLEAAKAIEAKREKATEPDGSILHTLTGQSATPELDDDEKTILLGAEAAFAFAACKFLPDELAAYRNRDDANRLIISGNAAAQRHA